MADHASVERDWRAKGYSFGIFRDPPGQRWEDFVHDVDELLMVDEGDVEVEIEGRARRPEPGEEVFIPARAVRSVWNVGARESRWFYGYRR